MREKNNIKKGDIAMKKRKNKVFFVDIIDIYIYDPKNRYALITPKNIQTKLLSPTQILISIDLNSTILKDFSDRSYIIIYPCFSKKAYENVFFTIEKIEGDLHIMTLLSEKENMPDVNIFLDHKTSFKLDAFYYRDKSPIFKIPLKENKNKSGKIVISVEEKVDN